MQIYQTLLQKIIDQGYYTGDRTGVGTQCLPGYAYQHNLIMDDDGIVHNFPLLTTKKVFLRGAFEELMWKLRGETNIRSLIEKDVHIWSEWPFKNYLKEKGLIESFPWFIDEQKTDWSPEWKSRMQEFEQRILSDSNFAQEWGDLGPTYGHHMRNFGQVLGKQVSGSFQAKATQAGLAIQENDIIVDGIDQLKEVINSIQTNPVDRRIIMTLWNPHDNKNTLLPPCPCFYQFFANQEGYLHVNVYQRSCDVFLGVPFNDSQDALLYILFAISNSRKPGSFWHFFGDVHIYNNHREQVKKQLAREPRPLPSLHIKTIKNHILDYTWNDIEDALIGYDPYPGIKAPVAV